MNKGWSGSRSLSLNSTRNRYKISCIFPLSILTISLPKRPVLEAIRLEVSQLNGENGEHANGETNGEANGHVSEASEEAGADEAEADEGDEKTPLQERMAIVRQNKKRRKRRRINPVRPTRSPSPKEVEPGHWSLDIMPVIEEGQFRAHVEEVKRQRIHPTHQS